MVCLCKNLENELRGSGQVVEDFLGTYKDRIEFWDNAEV